MKAGMWMPSACLGIGLSSDGRPEGEADCPEVGHNCGAKQVARCNAPDIYADDLQRTIAHDVEDCRHSSKVQSLWTLGLCTGDNTCIRDASSAPKDARIVLLQVSALASAAVCRAVCCTLALRVQGEYTGTDHMAQLWLRPDGWGVDWADLFLPEAMVTFCPGQMLVVVLPMKSCRLMTKKSAFCAACTKAPLAIRLGLCAS